jgi:hypothetical protein
MNIPMMLGWLFVAMHIVLLGLLTVGAPPR